MQLAVSNATEPSHVITVAQAVCTAMGTYMHICVLGVINTITQNHSYN